MVQYPRTSVINHLHTDSYWVICVVSLDHWNVVLKPLECWKHLNHIPFVNKICKEIGHTSKYMAHDHALLYVYSAYQDTTFSNLLQNIHIQTIITPPPSTKQPQLPAVRKLRHPWDHTNKFMVCYAAQVSDHLKNFKRGVLEIALNETYSSI